MRKIFTHGLVLCSLVLLLLGCTPNEDIGTFDTIKYLQITSGGTNAMEVDNVEISESEFILYGDCGKPLRIIARNKEGVILNVKAEWSCTDGKLDETISDQTTFWPGDPGTETVTALVGSLKATAVVHSYAAGTIMSGVNIPNMTYAYNFKNHYRTNELSDADAVLYQKYRPNMPLYDEVNKIVFPNGFYPMEINRLEDILEIPEITEEQWQYEFICDFSNTGGDKPMSQRFTGIVRTIDGSLVKLIGHVGYALVNGEPEYLDASFDYCVTESNVFEF